MVGNAKNTGFIPNQARSVTIRWPWLLPPGLYIPVSVDLDPNPIYLTFNPSGTCSIYGSANVYSHMLLVLAHFRSDNYKHQMWPLVVQ